MFKKTLVISTHTDDAELGCGGTMSRLIDDGKEVFYVALSNCKNAIPAGFKKDMLNKECLNATSILGIKKNKVFIFELENKIFPHIRDKVFEILEKLNKEIKPDTVLIPSQNETHQDHRTVAKESIRAFRGNVNILCYEQPWNNLSFNTKFYVELEKQNIDKKLAALKAYKTQLVQKKVYFEEDFIVGLARVRGTQIGTKYAEAFEVIKMMI